MRFSPLPRVALAAEHSNGSGAARMPMLRIALCMSLLLLMNPVMATGAEAFSVDATRYGDAVQVNARATVKAPLALIWNTLTDYDHLAEFIPGMKKSRVIERHGKTAIVEQSGHVHLWLFRFPIDVTVEATEQFSSAIQVRLLKGNLRRLEGSYQLEKIGDDDNYALVWSGIIEPDIAVPGFIATALMRKNISEQFLGMIREIERRAALPPRGPPG